MGSKLASFYRGYRIVLLIVMAFMVTVTLLGLADLTFGLHWGYSWKLVGLAPFVILLLYAKYRYFGAARNRLDPN